MPKLLWVLLPLAAAVVWLALRAWRRGMPSRQALNMLFSLLLLGYVSATAGLGIFWVANQQLPVFDWHYLFGYATVLLLIVHLTFNLRAVWQYLRRTWGATPTTGTASAAVVARRRPLLGLAGAGGLALAAGSGYLLGLRHGRTELQLEAGRSIDTAGTKAGRLEDADAAGQAWAVVERFHAFSAHSRTRVLRHAASQDWGSGPPPFKAYAAVQRVPLPAPIGPTAAAHRAAPDLATLGSWLWHTAGISERRGGIAFRTSPSSGALFATELYVLALDVRGLAAGPWHYDPEGHGLQRLPPATGTNRGGPGALAAFGPLALPEGCHAVIVASVIFARSGYKYGDRTYRYVLADLGHALENLRVAARAHGNAEIRLLTHFDEQAIGAALGLDPRREAVLAVAALGPAGTVTAPMPSGAQSGLRWTSALPPGATGEAERLGLTEAMQRATSLRALPPARADGPASAPAQAASTTGTPTPAPMPAGPSLALPAARTPQADVLRSIALRRSRRRFSTQPVPAQALADVLHALTQPTPLLSPAVRIDVLTAAVAGIEPAAWRYGAAGNAAHGTLHRRVAHGAALRARARGAALDQDVIGDAALVFVLSLDRATLRADPAGPARGYRHAFIEAGMVGERIYLAAGALGLAACAVGAFYDDEAAALVGIDPAREWVLHFAALGAPA